MFYLYAMKTKIFVFSIFMFACSSQHNLDSQGKQEVFKVEVGEDFTFSLASNRTTGYQWHWENRNLKGIDLVSNTYVIKDASEGMVGVGGQSVWTFKGLSKGEYTLDMAYYRPFGEKAIVNSTKIKVIVQ